MTRKTNEAESARRGGREAASAGRTGNLTQTLSRTERKEIRQLLRRSLAGPIRLDAASTMSNTDATAADPSAALVARLVSVGLLTPSPEGYRATPETAAWLRRDLCDLTDEAHQSQHRVVEVQTLAMPDGRQSVRRNLQESPLFPLLRLKERDGRCFLPEQAVAAGERLAADFDFAGLQPRITASWEPRLSSRSSGAAPPAVELADSTLAARRRVTRALEAMGPELSGVALDVCCFGKGLETVERERQWPARSAKLMLRAALLTLARHYTPPPPRPRPRHWGEEGFRPEIG